ncbi:MAG: zinc ABC transporter substrate-binding protein [Deltaproteobacteria bacterium]|nr:zinc ABC transporter substrate-binding protein [Deltaproteobacteria bacterium]
MSINRSLTLPLAALLSLWSAAPAAHALKIVATVEDVASIAREVLGKDGELITLANPSQDPHFVDPRPSLLLPLSRADALLVVGLELEVGWLPTLLKGARNGNIQLGGAGYIDASSFIMPTDVPTGPVDRSQGDIHPRGNPHYLKDPHNAVLVANGLAERFVSLDPERADAFRKRAADFAKAIEGRIKAWETRLAVLKGKGLVSYHKSLNYFARWAQLDQVGYVESKPGIPPSPQHMVQLIALGRARKAAVFATESWFPTAQIEFAAEKCGRPVTAVPGLPRSNQPYADHIEDVVAAFIKGAS